MQRLSDSWWFELSFPHIVSPHPPCLSVLQTKAFGSAETDQLYAEEAATKIAEAQHRLQAIPGMVPPNQVNDEMGDT